MKQYQQADYTAKETAVQVVLPLDVETLIPEEDSARTLMRIAERMHYTKLSVAYERENPREAAPKQLFLPVVLGYMEGKYATGKIEKARPTDTRFMWLLGGKPAPDHTRISRFLQRISAEILEDLFCQVVRLLHEDGEIAYEHLFVDGTKIEANANRYTFVWRKRAEKGMAKLAGKRKTQLQRDIEALEALLQKAQEYAEHMDIPGDRQLKPGYNVQLGIEAEYIPVI